MAYLTDPLPVVRLDWPTVTSNDFRSDIRPKPRHPKLIEVPAPPGKSARRRRLEERWAKKQNA